MFLKMKAEQNKSSPNGERMGLLRRKGSHGNGGGSSDEEEAAEDMGIFGHNLVEFRKKQAEMKNSNSPQKEDPPFR